MNSQQLSVRSDGEHDVYDNTRIIIVADHGWDLFQSDALLKDQWNSLDRYYPLLMVKDFNSINYNVSDEFMTNADVPVIATRGIIENPINPFTGKHLDNNEKYDHEQFVIISWEFDVAKNNGTAFLPARWYAVKDNIWDKNNWRYIDEVTTMPSELLE